MQSSLSAWIRLLRLPNVLTVPGDVWVGLAISSAGLLCSPAAILACVAACCLYLAGMAQNALVDLEEDRQNRPERPLPSGEISIGSAHLAQRLCFNLGVAAGLVSGGAVAPVALALFGCVWAYNRFKRYAAILGAVLMGACRALSLGLGIAAGGGLHPAYPWGWSLPAFWGLYIAGVTLLAGREHLPGGIQPRHIGGLIRMLLPFQALVMFWAGSPTLAGCLLVCALAHWAWSARGSAS